MWRLFGVAVPASLDPGKDDLTAHPALREAAARFLGATGELAEGEVTLVRGGRGKKEGERVGRAGAVRGAAAEREEWQWCK